MTRSIRPLPAVFLALLAAAGCGPTYRRQVVVAPDGAMPRLGFALVARPKDGSFGKFDYPNSGKETADAVVSGLMGHVDRVLVQENCADLECLKREAPAGVTHFVVPVVAHWEDRNTQWSGIPDVIRVQITVVEAATDRVLASAVVQGEGSRVVDDGQLPERLLRDPVNAWFDSLYGEAR